MRIELEEIPQGGSICLRTDRIREGKPLPFCYTQEYLLTFRREGVFYVLSINEEPNKPWLFRTFSFFPITVPTYIRSEV